MAYVYILKSEKNTQFYIGCSSNPAKRLVRHNRGGVTSTKHKRPWKIVFKQLFPSKKQALQMEKKLKQMKSRAILEKIIQDQNIKNT